MTDSFVYFARAVGTDHIKIGLSQDPQERVSGLSTGSSAPIKLVAVMPGNRQTEQRLHAQFAASRLNGEWFRETPELLAVIAALAEFPMSRSPQPTVQRDPMFGQHEREYREMFLAVLKEAYGDDSERVAKDAGASRHSALNWLSGKCLPNVLFCERLAEANPKIAAWNVLAPAILGIAIREQISLFDAVASPLITDEMKARENRAAAYRQRRAAAGSPTTAGALKP